MKATCAVLTVLLVAAHAVGVTGAEAGPKIYVYKMDAKFRMNHEAYAYIQTSLYGLEVVGLEGACRQSAWRAHAGAVACRC